MWLWNRIGCGCVGGGGVCVGCGKMSGCFCVFSKSGGGFVMCLCVCVGEGGMYGLRETD